MNISNLFNRVKNNLYVNNQINYLSNRLQTKGDSPRIYFFCTPIHSNLGDQAQLFCWLRLFKRWYPHYEVVCLPSEYRTFQTLRSVRKSLKDGDKIFIHSGYLLYDPHPELPYILDIVRAFYDYPITILPQTINLMEDWYKQLVSKQFAQHHNLTIMCRDEVSLGYAKRLFPSSNSVLLPDVATTLIGDPDFLYKNTHRKGVLFCIRDDGEKFYKDSDIKNLRNKFRGYRTEQLDTTINAQKWEWDKNREVLIRSILEKMSEFQVIITDRYHGTIFSQIANTPVVVISSMDHKLRSGVKWFHEDIFKMSVFYAEHLEDAYEISHKILEDSEYNINNPSWFYDNFYKTKFA